MDNPIVGMAGALCVTVAVLVAVVAVFSGRRTRRHRDRMQRWADDNGWTFTPRPAVDWGSRLPGGNSKGVTDAFSKFLHDRWISVAEYSVTDAGDGTSTNTQWYVVTIAVLHHSLPATQVEPRGRTSRLIGKLFGMDDSATGNADFDRAFRVRTIEPTGIHHRIPPPLITAHLTGRVPTTWNARGTELLHWQPGRLHPDDIPGHASVIQLLADLLDA